MSQLSEIDTISRDVASRTREMGEFGATCASARQELLDLFESLVGEGSSTEVKHKFQLVAMDVAEKAAKMGEMRKELRAVSTTLLDLVKADGRTSLSTVDGVELTLTPTLQFKMPAPPTE